MYVFLRAGKRYELVKFRRGSIEIVPNTWKNGDNECFFPTSCKDEEHRRDKVASCCDPKPRGDYKKYPVTVVYASGM